MLTQSSFFTSALVAASLLWASNAGALQFSLPSVDTRLHTLTSLQPGAEWNTTGTANLSYSSVTQQLTLTANLDVLNYHDPNGGAGAGVVGAPCTTDAGSNCSFNFASDPTILLVADLNSIVVINQGAGLYSIDLNFETTGGNDITVTDPTDNTVLLTGSWQAGSFQNNPTTGLTVSALFDSNFGSLVIDPTSVGFAVVTGGAYAQLLDSGGSQDIALNIAAFNAFSPSEAAIALALISTGTLPSFTAEGEGQVYRVASGDFEAPEPGALLLVGAGAGLVAVCRRRAA
jgi:hypothetical protein